MGLRNILAGMNHRWSKEHEVEESFDKVIFLDEDKITAERSYLGEIERLKSFCNEEEKEKIDEKVRYSFLRGIEGEKEVRRKLGYCDFYCNILSDINLYDKDLENQIDFLVITKKMCFVIECKNWSKTTKVLADGRFERQIYGQGKGKLKQVPSPIEQNNEHTQLVKNIYMKNRKNFSKTSKNESIDDRFLPVLVWVNNNAELNLQDTTEHIKNEVEKQFVYAERLATHLNKIYKDSLLHEKSVEEVEELSRIFMEIHKENEEEYIRKNRQRAFSAVLETLEFVPQDFLKRELEAYRKLDWVNEIIKTKNKKYKEHLLDEEMIEKLTEKMPANEEELIQIDWFKAFTYENFGEDILEILDRYREIK